MKKTLITTLAVVCIVLLLVFLSAQMRRTAAAELALSENTLSAVAEASASLQELTVSLEKLLIATSPEQSAQHLSDTAIHADRVQHAIGLLPDAQGERGAIQAHLSQLSRLASELLMRLATGDTLHREDRTSLLTTLDGLRLLQSEFSFAQDDLHHGDQLSDALPHTEITAKPTAQELSAYRALPSGDVTSGRAMEIAQEFVGLDRVTSVSRAPDTTGALPAYGVTVQTDDVQLNLEITRQGGKVLLMVPETAAFSTRTTPEVCAKAALQFLKDRGFPTMEATHYQVYDGLCVISCTYVEKDVLIWADRVTVQVRMDKAEVVGIESRSFWKNHTPRRLTAPTLTQAEAAASLTPDAQVGAARLCLLPHGNTERLCWQFTLYYLDDTYAAYIDALTGQELLLEKMMQLEYGETPA